MTFKQDDDYTPVVFRTFANGDVIALFPYDNGTNDPATCGSFEHVGQHGAADPFHVIQATRLATPEEFADLKKELESAPYGYRLKILQRCPRNAYTERARRLTQN